MDNTIFTQSYNAIHHATELGKPEWRAIALIIQAYQGHEIVDFYGAAPFSDWRNLQRNPPLTYERGEDIYTQIFNDLDEAIRILKERQPSRDEIAKIEDLTIQTLSNGDWRMWVKFANSIKMRMAMNIVKYDAGTAQQKFEQAVTDDIGLIQTPILLRKKVRAYRLLSMCTESALVSTCVTTIRPVRIKAVTDLSLLCRVTLSTCPKPSLNAPRACS